MNIFWRNVFAQLCIKIRLWLSMSPPWSGPGSTRQDTIGRGRDHDTITDYWAMNSRELHLGNIIIFCRKYPRSDQYYWQRFAWTGGGAVIILISLRCGVVMSGLHPRLWRSDIRWHMDDKYETNMTAEMTVGQVMSLGGDTERVQRDWPWSNWYLYWLKSSKHFSTSKLAEESRVWKWFETD